MKTQRILMILVLGLVFMSSGCRGRSDVTVLGMTSLHEAVISNDIEKAKLDISNGAWLDLRNESGQTALHYAVLKNNREMIQLLIENNADINLREAKKGQTPLHFAAKTEKKQAVELLLENKANPDIKDRDNKTPKQLAELTGNKEIVNLFQKYGY